MITSVLINIDGRRLVTGEGRAESHLLGREHEPRAAVPNARGASNGAERRRYSGTLGSQ
jgi:hypothetical protein